MQQLIQKRVVISESGIARAKYTDTRTICAFAIVCLIEDVLLVAGASSIRWVL